MRLEDSNIAYRNPALYDQLLSGDPTHTRLLAQLIATHGPTPTRTVLDLGCGTGRDLAALAPQLTGIGIDLQPRLIDDGRRTHPSLDLRVGDLRTIRLSHPADAITCLGNTLAYLHTNHDRNAAFDTFTAHTHPGTVLVIHTLIHPPRPHPCRTTAIELPSGTATVTISTDYDPNQRIATTPRRWTLSSGRQEHDLIRRRVTPLNELQQHLTQRGFRRTAVEPNNDRQPTAYLVATTE
jgi:SAM-dependent methyltransferase